MNKDGFALIDEADMSGDISSTEVEVAEADYGSVHLEWNGSSPDGTITVQAKSGDNDEWYVVDMGVPITIVGNSGEHQLIFTYLPFTMLRIVYTRTSGTGILMGSIVTKKEGIR